MHAPPQLGFHLAQLRLQPFAYRLPQHREPSVAPLVSADVRKAKEVERLRLPFSVFLPVADRVGAELQKARFLGMQFSWNFRKRSVSSAQNRSASDFNWNPTTMSSANLTTITSPQARFRRHAWTQRSNT